MKERNRLIWAVVAAITLIGAVLRFKVAGSSLFGDELSTLWIVQDQSLGDVITRVASDAEITPPLYFVFAWIATQFGNDPDLVRLPAVIAGILTIPLGFVVGRRMIGTWGALIATGIIAVSPYLVQQSAAGRSYSLGIALLLLSTLFILIAVEDGRKRWWVFYGISICLVMYSHYTMVFVLIGQFAWVLWAHPESRRAVIVATGLAACAYLPWVPSVIADSESVTTAIMEKIQGDGVAAKVEAFQQVLFSNGNPFSAAIRDRLDVIMIALGLLVAAGGAGWRWYSRKTPPVLDGATHRGFSLALIMTVSTAIGATVALLAGTDILGGRNLAATWTGLPFVIGALVAMNGRRTGIFLTVLLIAGFSAGSIRQTDSTKVGIPYREAAEFVESSAGPGATIVDASHVSPAPQATMRAYLPETTTIHEPALPPDRPDFIETILAPEDPQIEADRGFSGPGPVELITLAGPEHVTDESFYIRLDRERPISIPPGWEITGQETFRGVIDVTVTTFERRNGNAGSG